MWSLIQRPQDSEALGRDLHTVLTEQTNLVSSVPRSRGKLCQSMLERIHYWAATGV
ncbi:MAG: hypothetical protein ACRDNK_14040 [Solirubrobacteraceae bacterium]